MSHTQDMVMITPAFSLEIFEGNFLVLVKQNNVQVLNSRCVKATADTNIVKHTPQGRRQEHPKRSNW